MQEFLSGAEVSNIGKDEFDKSLTPKPSFDDSNKWVKWCAYWVETLAWWPELQRVPSQRNTLQFTKQVWASFQLPKTKCLTQGTENDYTLPPTPHYIEQDAFLPFGNGNFASHDYSMKQPQETLVYAKVLQFWVKRAQPSLPGQPHQLAACMKELRESIELLTSFPNEEVLTKELLSHWVKITSYQPSELAEPEIMQE